MTGSCQGLWGRENGLLDGYGIFFCSGKSVLELNSGGGSCIFEGTKC